MIGFVRTDLNVKLEIYRANLVKIRLYHDSFVPRVGSIVSSR
jgi:hypothetical protein